MEIKRITMYLCKSSRANSKCITKGLDIVKVSKPTKLKTTFKKDDIIDFIDKVVCCKENYPVIRFCVYDGNFCICNWNSFCLNTSIEEIVNHVYKYMQYLNGKEFDFTLSELHEDKRIRYHINKYYHND